MEPSQLVLMKHFSTVLRKKALGKYTGTAPDPMLLKHFSRKDLISLLAEKQGGIKEMLNVAEMESEELLRQIGSEMFILAHLADKWASEESDLPAPNKAAKEEPPAGGASSPAKKKANGK